MPGIQAFTRLNIGKETVRGTPVAPTRKLYMEATGVLAEDAMLSFHEGENRGRRSEVARVTQQGEAVALNVRTLSDAGIGYDELVIPCSQLSGGKTGVGGGADKTWSFTPAMAAANNPEAYSLDAGDDVQNWRIQYGMISTFELSAGRNDLTQLASTWFGQRAVKTAAAAPGDNAAVKIPGSLWTVKFAGTFAGLGGAAVQTNLLLSWKLTVRTGLIFRFYQDGNLYGAQHVETRQGATLELTVESTAFAVSEFYDKWKAQTQDYVRLKATGPALGASNYSAQFDLPILFSDVKPIDSQDDGVNVYKITAHANDDGTNPPITPTLVNSIAALP